MEPSPAAVAELVTACERFVRSAVGVELDLTPETLPLLDHYLQSARGSRDEVLALVAPAAGAYFGEVVRRAFDARWTGTDGSPEEWALEVGDAVIHFNPVGVAVEAILGHDAPGHHAAFSVRDADKERARAALEAQPPIDPADYYRLTVRFEVLEVLVDRLVARVPLRLDDDGSPDDDPPSGERPADS